MRSEGHQSFSSNCDLPSRKKFLPENSPKLAALRTINLAINVDQKLLTEHSIETRFYDASTNIKGLDLT